MRVRGCDVRGPAAQKTPEIWEEVISNYGGKPCASAIHNSSLCTYAGVSIAPSGLPPYAGSAVLDWVRPGRQDTARWNRIARSAVGARTCRRANLVNRLRCVFS